MKRTYITGEDDNTISLGVKVQTAGIACTTVYSARSGGQQLKINDSADDSGAIREAVIGKASELRNSYLLIITMIDRAVIDPTEWDNLLIRYHINGGYSGSQVFNHDIDDTKLLPNGKMLIIKPIEMK
ncbi:hypothetical protein [Gaoshiqia sediminis]|uniref:Uncharacterized protein n=1 Tax=Gaoshiqia sediminis TaxID=2986998 RepID=A0AA41Y9Y2_9BACT|nr:hypothetical protein [Gaoshiqia sediminis]MCW0483997.1 hypothetical protein [Gaoshiqia sediminis]